MVVAALLAVVVGQAFLANGQVKLAVLQHELSVEQSAHRQAELAVAKLETPTRIVADATTQLHMVTAGGGAAPSVIELPYVSLSVPLPPPKVSPAPAPPPPTTPSAGAGAPPGNTTGGTSGTSGASSTTSSASAGTTTATTTP
jgi:hypothetical protein